MLELSVENVYALERAISFDGMTALSCATIAGDGRIMHRLVELGADVNKLCLNGNTALFYATTADHCKLLIDAGANPNVVNFDGATPLTRMILSGMDDGPIEYLIRNGSLLYVYRSVPIDDHVADGSSSSSYEEIFGDIALHLAVQNGRARIVQLLLEAGADPNLRDEFTNHVER